MIYDFIEEFRNEKKLDYIITVGQLWVENYYENEEQEKLNFALKLVKELILKSCTHKTEEEVMNIINYGHKIVTSHRPGALYTFRFLASEQEAEKALQLFSDVKAFLETVIFYEEKGIKKPFISKEKFTAQKVHVEIASTKMSAYRSQMQYLKVNRVEKLFQLFRDNPDILLYNTCYFVEELSEGVANFE